MYFTQANQSERDDPPPPPSTMAGGGMEKQDHGRGVDHVIQHLPHPFVRIRVSPSLRDIFAIMSDIELQYVMGKWMFLVWCLLLSISLYDKYCFDDNYVSLNLFAFFNDHEFLGWHLGENVCVWV